MSRINVVAVRDLLAERCATTILQLAEGVAMLVARVEEHLNGMGAAWK